MNLQEPEMIERQSDGSLVVKLHGFNEVWRPWGHPEGFGVDGAETDKETGAIKALFMDHILRHSEHDTINRPKLKDSPITDELKSITQSIPQQLLNAIFHLPNYLIEGVMVAQYNVKAFIKLAETNPALTIILLREVAMSPLWEPEYYGHILSRKQNYIARELGFEPGFGKFLQKFESQTLCSLRYLELAIKAWKKPGMKRLFKHLIHINLDVLITAIDYWLIVTDCPSLLFIATEDPHASAFSHAVYEKVSSIMQLRCKMHDSGWPYRLVRDLEHLSEIERKTEIKANKCGIIPVVDYPLPPILPCNNWDWISDSQELKEHSVAYSNCAETYNWKCLAGQAAIYVSRFYCYQETVIVLIEKVNNQKWAISDILGPGNSQVNDEATLDAREYFEERLNFENS